MLAQVQRQDIHTESSFQRAVVQACGIPIIEVQVHVCILCARLEVVFLDLIMTGFPCSCSSLNVRCLIIFAARHDTHNIVVYGALGLDAACYQIRGGGVAQLILSNASNKKSHLVLG